MANDGIRPILPTATARRRDGPALGEDASVVSIDMPAHLPLAGDLDLVVGQLHREHRDVYGAGVRGNGKREPLRPHLRIRRIENAHAAPYGTLSTASVDRIT